MVAEAELKKAKRVAGGSFLIEDLAPEDIFTVEEFSPEQIQIHAMATSFAEEKILVESAGIEAKQYDISKRLLRELGDLGLLGVDVPEAYGGLELDKITSTIVATQLSVQGSFTVTFSAHAGIGTLPLVWYGTAEQKAKYLPRLASGEWIAAYALSESSSGSDAMKIRTRATLMADGAQYVLNGEKMWISNAGFANLFTVFAKIDGERFSAFLVEAGTDGLSVGAEEHKLGIRGSSTCALTLSDCKVPVENLLGEAGKGHHIAFNVLNVGRYKLAANALGTGRIAFRDGVRYARERTGFGKAITEFGLIQEKIADSAAALYALESTLYRVVGAIDAALEELSKTSPTYTYEVQKRIEEFAAECSILKVFGSEVLERVVTNTLQMHGGYGYVEDYPAERHYRDARINLIFEGTNEINRQIITGSLMKRAMQGSLALLPAIQQVMDEAMSGAAARATSEGPLAEPRGWLAQGKKIALFSAGAASQRFGAELADQQEVMGAIADILTEVLVLESTLLRTEKQNGASEVTIHLAQYAAARSFRVIVNAAERVLSAVAEGDALRAQMAILRRLSKHEPINTIAIGRAISKVMVEAGQYTLRLHN